MNPVKNTRCRDAAAVSAAGLEVFVMRGVEV